MPKIRPKNWLVESILTTIFCCLPFGIAGIVNANAVNSRYDSGDYEGALRASKQAAMWTKVSFWVAIGFWVLYVILMVILGVSLFSMGRV
ncbi:CD225/dispanin family protein [Mucilaginibacter hurinus]|uniref:CD225/dispanin family protein n=1 Tax=Mucilaginibacter hurinus TaxID=2201324 RepID=UPI0018F4DFF7|nr:CD225/dispanin family protein [Mucilaginibacter hurinus]